LRIPPENGTHDDPVVECPKHRTSQSRSNKRTLLIPLLLVPNPQFMWLPLSIPGALKRRIVTIDEYGNTVEQKL
jgi:hypothetical protein